MKKSDFLNRSYCGTITWGSILVLELKRFSFLFAISLVLSIIVFFLPLCRTQVFAALDNVNLEQTCSTCSGLNLSSCCCKKHPGFSKKIFFSLVAFFFCEWCNEQKKKGRKAGGVIGSVGIKIHNKDFNFEALNDIDVLIEDDESAKSLIYFINDNLQKVMYPLDENSSGKYRLDCSFFGNNHVSVNKDFDKAPKVYAVRLFNHDGDSLGSFEVAIKPDWMKQSIDFCQAEFKFPDGLTICDKYKIDIPVLTKQSYVLMDKMTVEMEIEELESSDGSGCGVAACDFGDLNGCKLQRGLAMYIYKTLGKVKSHKEFYREVENDLNAQDCNKFQSVKGDLDRQFDVLIERLKPFDVFLDLIYRGLFSFEFSVPSPQHGFTQEGLHCNGNTKNCMRCRIMLALRKELYFESESVFDLKSPVACLCHAFNSNGGSSLKACFFNSPFMGSAETEGDNFAGVEKISEDALNTFADNWCKKAMEFIKKEDGKINECDNELDSFLKMLINGVDPAFFSANSSSDQHANASDSSLLCEKFGKGQLVKNIYPIVLATGMTVVVILPERNNAKLRSVVINYNSLKNSGCRDLIGVLEHADDLVKSSGSADHTLFMASSGEGDWALCRPKKVLANRIKSLRVIENMMTPDRGTVPVFLESEEMAVVERFEEKEKEEMVGFFKEISNRISSQIYVLEKKKTLDFLDSYLKEIPQLPFFLHKKELVTAMVDKAEANKNDILEKEEQKVVFESMEALSVIDVNSINGGKSEAVLKGNGSVGDFCDQFEKLDLADSGNQEVQAVKKAVKMEKNTEEGAALCASPEAEMVLMNGEDVINGGASTHKKKKKRKKRGAATVASSPLGINANKSPMQESTVYAGQACSEKQNNQVEREKLRRIMGECSVILDRLKESATASECNNEEGQRPVLAQEELKELYQALNKVIEFKCLKNESNESGEGRVKFFNVDLTQCDKLVIDALWLFDLLGDASAPLILGWVLVDKFYKGDKGTSSSTLLDVAYLFEHACLRGNLQGLCSLYQLADLTGWAEFLAGSILSVKCCCLFFQDIKKDVPFFRFVLPECDKLPCCKYDARSFIPLRMLFDMVAAGVKSSTPENNYFNKYLDEVWLVKNDLDALLKKDLKNTLSNGKESLGDNISMDDLKFFLLHCTHKGLRQWVFLPSSLQGCEARDNANQMQVDEFENTINYFLSAAIAYAYIVLNNSSDVDACKGIGGGKIIKAAGLAATYYLFFYYSALEKSGFFAEQLELINILKSFFAESDRFKSFLLYQYFSLVYNKDFADDGALSTVLKDLFYLIEIYKDDPGLPKRCGYFNFINEIELRNCFFYFPGGQNIKMNTQYCIQNAISHYAVGSKDGVDNSVDDSGAPNQEQIDRFFKYDWDVEKACDRKMGNSWDYFYNIFANFIGVKFIDELSDLDEYIHKGLLIFKAKEKQEKSRKRVEGLLLPYAAEYDKGELFSKYCKLLEEEGCDDWKQWVDKQYKKIKICLYNLAVRAENSKKHDLLRGKKLTRYQTMKGAKGPLCYFYISLGGIFTRLSSLSLSVEMDSSFACVVYKVHKLFFDANAFDAVFCTPDIQYLQGRYPARTSNIKKWVDARNDIFRSVFLKMLNYDMYKCDDEETSRMVKLCLFNALLFGYEPFLHHNKNMEAIEVAVVLNLFVTVSCYLDRYEFFSCFFDIAFNCFLKREIPDTSSCFANSSTKIKEKLKYCLNDIILVSLFLINRDVEFDKRRDEFERIANYFNQLDDSDKEYMGYMKRFLDEMMGLHAEKNAEKKVVKAVCDSWLEESSLQEGDVAVNSVRKEMKGHKKKKRKAVRSEGVLKKEEVRVSKFDSLEECEDKVRVKTAPSRQKDSKDGMSKSSVEDELLLLYGCYQENQFDHVLGRVDDLISKAAGNKLHLSRISMLKADCLKGKLKCSGVDFECLDIIKQNSKKYYDQYAQALEKRRKEGGSFNVVGKEEFHDLCMQFMAQVDAVNQNEAVFNDLASEQENAIKMLKSFMNDQALNESDTLNEELEMFCDSNSDMSDMLDSISVIFENLLDAAFQRKQWLALIREDETGGFRKGKEEIVGAMAQDLQGNSGEGAQSKLDMRGVIEKLNNLKGALRGDVKTRFDRCREDISAIKSQVKERKKSS